MNKKMFIDAYVKIRTIDQTIPDEVLDFMKNAAIEKLSETNEMVLNIDKVKEMASEEANNDSKYGNLNLSYQDGIYYGFLLGFEKGFDLFPVKNIPINNVVLDKAITYVQETYCSNNNNGTDYMLLGDVGELINILTGKEIDYNNLAKYSKKSEALENEITKLEVKIKEAEETLSNMLMKVILGEKCKYCGCYDNIHKTDCNFLVKYSG